MRDPASLVKNVRFPVTTSIVGSASVNPKRKNTKIAVKSVKDTDIFDNFQTYKYMDSQNPSDIYTRYSKISVTFCISKKKKKKNKNKKKLFSTSPERSRTISVGE